MPLRLAILALPALALPPEDRLSILQAPGRGSLRRRRREMLKTLLKKKLSSKCSHVFSHRF